MLLLFCVRCMCVFIFFFKQKTAYEMRISDWSSDVCSSDLGGITQKELAALVGIDGSSLVRLLDILCRKGLVERRADESDGRARLIHLTPAGVQRVAEIRQELTRGEEGMLADLSDADIAAMLRHFERSEEHTSELQSLMRISYA